MNKVVGLHESDNVVVALSNLKRGDTISYNSDTFELLEDVNFGHKIALKLINKSEQVVKYGVPIGVATKNISKGSHIHTHNMESLYMNQFSK
ncbi:UxaA family hydrolase [Flavobacterium sp. ARAG 55.4]|uniref:UxaA family hydrolase n=1 Tax=Flavobacterium sp. ARAG 55.4 TaxID=3451357 RepID=UPI003F480F90